MADSKETPRPSTSSRHVEERLAQALVARGLVAPEEAQACRASDGAAGCEGLLERLVQAGALTRSQVRRLTPELAQLANQLIPGYELQEKLGQGAMGVVYRARQVSLNRWVAVKVLHPRLASNPELLDRLKQEAHLAARLSHNNIVQAIDVGSAGGVHYFVMELVEGRTIRQDLDVGRLFEEREAVDIVLQVAQALAHAHRRGLIHRDVKPANIVLTRDGVAKLADLGLARSAKEDNPSDRGMVVGTPYYIAPEQIRARLDIDGRADIYSLGATLYHMVTGQPPFRGDVETIFQAHLSEELIPPDHLNEELSAGLGEVIEVMMARKRDDRYRNADDLVIDLECLLAGEAPRLAHRKIGSSTLEALAEGEEERVEIVEVPVREGPANAWVWIAFLGTLFGLSLLLNLMLFLKIFRRS
jgi:serine/threonine-protein kinase